VSEGFHRRAVIGGIITVAASLVPFVGPFAPALGGGIAAWLAADTDDDGAMLGAAAGLVASLVALPVLVLFVVLVAGLSTAALVTLPLFLLATTAYTVGLSAVGGFAGEQLTAGTTQETQETNDAVERLKERYVAGDVTEPEFERRLERLVDADEDVVLDTDSVDAALDVAVDDSDGSDTDTDADAGTETEETTQERS